MTAAEYLNRLYKADPWALEAVMKMQVRCSSLLSEDPSTPCFEYTDWEEGPVYSISVLGIINGMLEALGEPGVQAKWDISGFGESLDGFEEVS